MVYHVVLFINSSEVAVIPDLWLKSDKECVWPPSTSATVLNKAVLNGDKPTALWRTYKVKKLYTTGNINRYVVTSLHVNIFVSSVVRGIYLIH